MPKNIQDCRSFAFYFIGYIKATRFIISWNGFINNLLNPLTFFLYEASNFWIQCFPRRKGADQFLKFVPNGLPSVYPIIFCFQSGYLSVSDAIIILCQFVKMIKDHAAGVIPFNPIMKNIQIFCFLF